MGTVFGVDHLARRSVVNLDRKTTRVALVVVRPPVSTTHGLQFIRTSALLFNRGSGLSKAFAPVQDTLGVAPGHAGVHVSLVVSSADGQVDGPTGRATGHIGLGLGVGVGIVSGADALAVKSVSRAFEVAVVVVGDPVGGAHRVAESLAVGALLGSPFGADAAFIESLPVALHETSASVRFSILRTNGLVDVGAVAGVPAGALVEFRLVRTSQSTLVFVGGVVVPANGVEGVGAGAVEVRRLGPIKIPARTHVTEGHVRALQPAPTGVGDPVHSADRVVHAVAGTGRVRVRVLRGAQIPVVRGFVGNGGRGHRHHGFGAPAVRFFLVAQKEQDAEIGVALVVGAADRGRAQEAKGAGCVAHRVERHLGHGVGEVRRVPKGGQGHGQGQERGEEET